LWEGGNLCEASLANAALAIRAVQHILW
jgi:hypothetical protein